MNFLIRKTLLLSSAIAFFTSIFPLNAAVADQGGYLTLQQGRSQQLFVGNADQLAAMSHDGLTVDMKTVSGTGGITVTPGAGTLVIGSSGLQGPGFVANTVSASTQTGAIGNAYFVTATATTFTLPTAVGNAGKQILVVNDSGSTTVTYASTSSQTINGATASGKSNATAHTQDLFTSDGTNWQAARLAAF